MLSDRGNQDGGWWLSYEKIIAIPFGDPTYNTYYDIQELPKHVFEEMMHFFEVYKSLEHKQTAVKEICHRDEAMEIIEKCIKAYKENLKELSICTP